MGTRHLIAVQVDGAYKIAQYGQWDGYPRGQGVNILKFLHSLNMGNISPDGLAAFKDRCRKLSFVSNEELAKREKAVGTAALLEQNPALSRDTSSGVLALVASGKVKEFQNSLNFVGDSLFCEWAYVIDLDKETFEVYKGFQKEPLAESERFYAFRQEGKYYPVKLLVKFDLNSLPTEQEFLSTSNELLEDEEE